ncbi:MAG: uracil phosphoribosyltransferase [Nitriliruptorales bacterium]
MSDNVILVDHPLAAELLGRLRDAETDGESFSAASHRLGLLLVLEATRDLPTDEAEVTTPVGSASVRRLRHSLVAIPVLRAGLGLLPAIHALYPGTPVGFLGLERDEETFEASRYYRKLPEAQGADVLVLEPMVATGGSASNAVTVAKEAGARSVRVVSVVAAPEGLKRMADDHPDVTVVTAAIDQGLNPNAYIVPGLGDYGDRLFAT